MILQREVEFLIRHEGYRAGSSETVTLNKGDLEVLKMSIQQKRAGKIAGITMLLLLRTLHSQFQRNRI